jgi:iron complex outermembrane receptor protein
VGSTGATCKHDGSGKKRHRWRTCLPLYKTLDLGALASIGANWEVRVSATILTNELGLTEGNSRLTGAQSSGPINARPIFGRAVEASLLYRF